jgi:hypothetical protein
MAAAALAAILTAGGAMADPAKTAVKVDPVPVQGGYPHAMSVAISPPWEQEGRWILRAPETIGSNHGLLFIDHSRPDMPPVTRPKHPLEWKRSRHGILFYDCDLENGISFSVRIRPGERDVEISSAITNGYVADMTDSGNQYCLIQKGVRGFEDPHAERTFIRVKGRWLALARTRPGPKAGEKPFFIVTNTADRPPLPAAQIERSWWAKEQADVPLIATVSEDGGRVTALAFDNSYKIMTNADIPCIHADPMFPDCPAGGTAQVRGKIYFVEGTLDDALALFARDFPQWRSGR